MSSVTTIINELRCWIIREFLVLAKAGNDVKVRISAQRPASSPQPSPPQKSWRRGDFLTAIFFHPGLSGDDV